MENTSVNRSVKLRKCLPPSVRRLLLSLLALALLVIPALSLLGSIAPAHAASSPPLGTAATFAVLGATTVTNTGPTVLNGDLGVSPGTSCTGFLLPPCTFGLGVVNGTIHAGDAVAAQAQTDAHTAYANAVGQTCNVNLTGQDLGGKTLTPAVYCFNSSAQLTGTLTLDCQGNPNAVFIFQIGSTLTTAVGSNVVLLNCPSPTCDNDNIFWAVGSSATLGVNTKFIGNILAQISITANTGASDNGSLYALTGAVTLDTNTISVCPMTTPTPTPSPSPTPTPPPHHHKGTFPADGAFVLGNLTAANSLKTGATVTWWSMNWSKLNSLSGGPAPARYGGPNSPRFQGFVSVDHPLPACGVTWSDRPEELPPPPSGIPHYMLVVVSSKITHSGTDTLSGNIIEIVIVKTNPGYNGNPNTPGTGTVVGVFCHS